MTTPLTRLATCTAAATLLGSSLVLVAPAAGAHPSVASTHCRKQTFSWTRGKKVPLGSTKGPRVRTHGSGSLTLTDNLVTISFEPGGQVPTKYVNVTGNTPQTGDQLTRLQSVTITPTKGKSKTYRIVANANKDYVYSHELLKDYEQVQLPVNGKNSEGLKIQKLKKVVVKATENCFSTQ